MGKKICQLLITFCTVLFTAMPLFATIRLSAIFGNNMVLQRETNVNIWGTANANANVEVTTSWNGKTYSAQALANGRWKLKVPTPAAGGPYIVAITDKSDNHTVTLNDVLIGEVWVCSGQSNMSMPMKGYPKSNQPIEGSAAAIASSYDPQLRLFTVPNITGAAEPQDTFSGQPEKKRWNIADSAATTNFGAVAYFFGRMLRQKLNIPIGIVNSSWGGTKIETWMSEGSLAEINPNLNMPSTETAILGNAPKKSSTLFNYMINPMVGYGIRGALWYQGEGNTGQAEDYQKLLPAMIKDWRAQWGLGDFPFYYVQIAPFGANNGPNNGARLREAQLHISNPALTPNLPNVGMVCALDVGEQNSVHPAKKEILSKRLANLAFSNIYNIRSINPYSPVLKKMTIAGNVATLAFETFSDTISLIAAGGTLSNFEIAGADRVFYPGEAVITSAKVITVQSTSVPVPCYVRYGFKNFITGDLFGSNGLPVSSFRTEEAPLVIYSNYHLKGNEGKCAARTIYTDASIPNGLDNKIKSISLSKGYMAVLAENTDGSGERFSYMAINSDLNVNLTLPLQNKVSFIRVLPLPGTPVKKKGAGGMDNRVVDSLKVGWLYDWGFKDFSTPTREYVPMAWGKFALGDAKIDSLMAKKSLTTYLAFNEPDADKQSGAAPDIKDPNLAVAHYKTLLRAGYRMGSPVTTEGQYNKWLKTFTDTATQLNAHIDFVAVHWYDWADWIKTHNADLNPDLVFERFKDYINAVYNLYQKPIWVTEFNANRNRPSPIHEAFMKLALPWLDSDPRIERYAYFFPPGVPATDSIGGLTPAGKVYSDHTSVNAHSDNVYDKRPTYLNVAAWWRFFH